MTKDQIEALLNQIELEDERLKKEFVRVALTGYQDDQDLSDWEQLRFIKQKVDSVWRAVKRCSERDLVSAKVGRMMAAFPRPKDLGAKSPTSRKKK